MSRITRGMACIALLAGLLLLPACSSSTEDALEMGQEAQALLQQRRVAEAEERILEAIAEREDLPELHLIHGQIALAAGKRIDAFRAYQSALLLDFSNPEALVGVSQLGLEMGYSQESEAATDAILTLNPRQPMAILFKGIISLFKKREDEAIEYADRLLAIDPNSEEALILKIRALAAAEKPNEAMELVSGNAGNSNAMLLTMLELYRASRNGEKMVEIFERLMGRKDLKDIQYLRIDYADTLYKLGEKEKARAIVHQLLVDQIKEPPMLEDLLVLWQEYDPEQPIKPELDFLAEKGSVESRVEIGRQLIAENRAADAARILAPVSGGHWPLARARYARAMYAAGNEAAALQIVPELLEQDKTQADALIIQSDVALKRGDTVAAINDAQLVVRDYPRMPAGYIQLVKIYQAKEDAANVERVYKDAIENMPQNLLIFRNFAEFLMVQRNHSRALATARRLAANAPALIGGWRLYADICNRVSEVEKRGCKFESTGGLTEAKSLFGPDLEPGTPRNRGLFGRIK